MFIKGFDENLQCRGFQFEIGKEYKIESDEELRLCSDTVFHFCDSLDYNTCKFCGAKIGGAKYLTPIQKSCNNCGKYCMDKCQEVYNTKTSWHSEPCVSCAKNPYRRQHIFHNGEWVRNNV